LTFCDLWVILESIACGGRNMFETLDIRHWLIIAVLILVNVAIFGCMILLLTGKVVLPI
jgi:hypothetical protein